MKLKIVIACLAIISLFMPLRAEWSRQFVGSQTLNDVDFPPNNLNIGYAVGNNSYYLKTINGGTNWDSLLIIPSGNLNSVDFPVDEMNGYIACDEGNVLKTTDGGEVWELNNTGTGLTLNAIQFPVDNDTGFVVGDDGSVKRTLDAGLSWEELPVPIPTTFNGVYFINNMQGWIVGNEGIVFYTLNGGFEWTEQPLGVTENLLGVYFQSALNGWVVGENNTFFMTTDGGQEWNRVNSPLPTGIDIHAVIFPTDLNTGFICGSAGYIARTTDNGTSWEYESFGSQFDLQSLEFPADNQTGWVCGTNGIIFNTTDGGGVWIEESNLKDQTKYKIFSCQPNPYYQTTVIQVPRTMSREHQSDINIYDITGKIVRKLTLTHSADNSIIWDGRNFNHELVTPGIYFLELNQDNRFTHRLKVVKSD